MKLLVLVLLEIGSLLFLLGDVVDENHVVIQLLLLDVSAEVELQNSIVFIIQIDSDPIRFNEPGSLALFHHRD